MDFEDIKKYLMKGGDNLLFIIAFIFKTPDDTADKKSYRSAAFFPLFQMEKTPFFLSYLEGFTANTRDISQPDFTTEWGNRCDITIKTQNSETLLYANKSILAVHSPFFEALFFGGFKESKQDTVEVNIDYEIMLEILKILHHVGRNCRFLERNVYYIRLAVGTLDNKVYSATELVALYRAAELFDISLIRGLCQQHSDQIPIKDAFEIALELGLHNEKSEILKQMSYADINQFLSKRSEELVFSPADTVIIVEKSHKKDNLGIEEKDHGIVSSAIDHSDITFIRRSIRK